MIFTKLFSRGFSLLLLSLIVLLLTRPNTAHACFCISQSVVDDEVWALEKLKNSGSELVFTGRIQTFELYKPSDDANDWYKHGVFQVDTVYKGEASSTVTIYTAGVDDLCGEYFESFDEEQTYLIFAQAGEYSGGVSLGTTHCAGNGRPEPHVLAALDAVIEPSPNTIEAVLTNIYEGCISGTSTLVGTLDLDSDPMRVDCPYSAGHSYTVEVFNLSSTTCDPESTVADSHGIPNALTTYTKPLDEWCIKTSAFNDTPLGVTAEQAFNSFFRSGVEAGLFIVEGASIASILTNLGANCPDIRTLYLDREPLVFRCRPSAEDPYNMYTIEVSDLSSTTCDPESTTADSTNSTPGTKTTYTQPLDEWCIKTNASHDAESGVVTASGAFDLLYEKGIEIGLFSTEATPLSITLSQQSGDANQTWAWVLMLVFVLCACTWAGIGRTYSRRTPQHA